MREMELNVAPEETPDEEVVYQSPPLMRSRGTMYTTLKWFSLVRLLAACPIVGHVVSRSRVSKLVFEYPDGRTIEVPAGCRNIEIHCE